MSHSPSRHAIDKEQARRRAEAARIAAAEAEAARTYARRIVALWNARAAQEKPASHYPTIGTVIDAGMPFLTFLCPACRQIGEVDVRSFQRHPGATIASLIPALSCRRCSPNPPFARLIGLTNAPAVKRRIAPGRR